MHKWGQLKAIIWHPDGLVGSIEVNGWWQYNDEKDNIKIKVNGFEASYALAMLGNIVLNIMHDVHR